MVDSRVFIRSLRSKNWRGQFYIPEALYMDYMKPDVIKDVLSRNGFEPWKIDEMLAIIMDGARKVFGILILIRKAGLFMKFVEQHQGDTGSLDSQLPFHREKLYYLDADMAEEFLETQWMFTSPVFARRLTHRFFDDDTVLPFIEEQPLAEGGFGRVSIIKIRAGYHHYYHSTETSQLEDFRLVRKDLDMQQKHLHERRQQFSKALANDEHTVLWMLNHLKHPNILELLASYTFHGVHSFLFPAVDGGNVKDFLKSTAASSMRWSHSDYFSGLAGLTSAVQHLHNYRLPSTEITLIGCHHDIKPANILVRGKSFVLADFGLSTFREGENSQTAFKIGSGMYKAPECEDYDEGFKPGNIGRAMDIWALGCIMMEVLIHYHWGAEGVSQFKTDRRTEIPGIIITYGFHCGSSPNSGVQRWLQKLETVHPCTQLVAQEAKNMLSLHPSARPKAEEICLRLCYAEASSIFGTVRQDLDGYLQEDRPSELRLEVERFYILGDACFLNSPQWSTVTASPNVQHRLPTCISLCSEISGTLIENKHDSSGALLGSQLGLINNRFSELLSPEERERITTKLLESFILKSQEQNTVKSSSGLISDVDVGKHLAAIQILSQMSVSDDQYDEGLRCRPEHLINRRPFEAGEFAYLLDPVSLGEQKGKVVLIEWITYDATWIGDPGSQLLNRVGRITRTLRSLSSLGIFPTLYCEGFFHELHRHAFGLVYQLPLCDSPEIQEPNLEPPMVSMSQMIETTKNVRRRPFLEDIYQLALDLATSLLEFHRVDWLHKGLSSYCILFPCAPVSKEIVQTKDFYVCGFKHSRPDRPEEYSNGLCQKPDREVLYQHPDYRQRKSGYCRKFDRYSLGIILLELGLWKPVHEMIEGMKHGARGNKTVAVENAVAFQQHLLHQFVPLLSQRMGSNYRSAVESCLNGLPDTQESELIAFEMFCITSLRKHCATNL